MNLSWAAQSLRLSVFTDGPIHLSDKDWTALTGQEESETRTNIPGGRVFSGPTLGGVLVMQHQATRADFILNADEANPHQELGIPAVGWAPEVLPGFIDATSRWLNAVDRGLIRIAFGAALLSPTSGVNDSYAALTKLLRSVDLSGGRMRDLLFRCNWPRRSAHWDLEINRLTTWGAFLASPRTIQLSGRELHVVEGEERHFVRLEIDHNTSAGSTSVLPSDVLLPIYSELVGLAEENMREGECR